jgi:adenylate cyclase
VFAQIIVRIVRCGLPAVKEIALSGVRRSDRVSYGVGTRAFAACDEWVFDAGWLMDGTDDAMAFPRKNGRNSGDGIGPVKERTLMMKRNVEIKAAVTDLAAIEEKAAKLADEGPVVLEQEDVFFHCPRGRLKLRRFATRAELIAYERPDALGPKPSRYVVHRTDDPDGLQNALSLAMGIRGVVRKRRTLYVIGQTRVHLDHVQSLGDFVELEVVLAEDQDVGAGFATVHRLMASLGISDDQLVEKAYIDLLLER